MENRMNESDNSEKIFGLSIEQYAAGSVDAPATNLPNHNPIPNPNSERLIEEVSQSIAKIEQDQVSIAQSIESLLQDLGERLGKHGIKLNRCTRLDITALDIKPDLDRLRQLHAAKEKNARSILRLQAETTRQHLTEFLKRAELAAHKLLAWQAAVATEATALEKDLLARSSIYEIRAADHLLTKQQSFLAALPQVDKILSLTEHLVLNQSHIYPKQDQEELAYSETLIRHSSELERTTEHLLGLLK
ncbi:hypothetical protein NEHOM01_0733 [Nematocida homosporus]|uniref:uncharacterized protein n=1 Tax=Nematocida homosporus TaxID=1912981 RepID=UPI00221F052A|nr:uncharacterized protein NEHOM01_0733 [Nematocida homosporus]KAI5185275.1 hypothetical protein NEHOM01_0733 [Nematocida homosporus]